MANIWNEYTENVLRQWHSYCQIYSMMHNKCSLKYNSYQKYLSVPVTVLSAVTTSTIFLTLQSDERTTPLIVVGVTSLISTIMHAMDKSLDLNGTSNKHKSASADYDEITLDIDRVLSFARENRPQVIEFINGIKQRMKSLRQSGATINEDVYNEYVNKIQTWKPVEINRHLHARTESNQSDDTANNSIHNDVSDARLDKQLAKLMPIVEEVKLDIEKSPIGIQTRRLHE